MPVVAAAASDMSIPSGKTNTQVPARLLLVLVFPSQFDDLLCLLPIIAGGSIS